jgi:hypothetical protein
MKEQEILALNKSTSSKSIQKPEFNKSITSLQGGDGQPGSSRAKKKSLKPPLNTGRSDAMTGRTPKGSLDSQDCEDKGFFATETRGQEPTKAQGRRVNSDGGNDHRVGWSGSEGGFDFLSQNNSLYEDANSAAYAPASTFSATNQNESRAGLTQANQSNSLYEDDFATGSPVKRNNNVNNNSMASMTSAATSNSVSDNNRKSSTSTRGEGSVTDEEVVEAGDSARDNIYTPF